MEMIDRINSRMTALGLNQNQLAQKMGKKQGTIWTLLSGRTKTFRDMPALAEALETTPQWLLTGDEPKPTHRGLTPGDGVFLDAVIKAAIRDKKSPADKLIEVARQDLKNWLQQDRKAGQQSSLDQLIRVVRMRLEEGK